jgi:tetratricopeptide (TPR) repeat protein
VAKPDKKTARRPRPATAKGTRAPKPAPAKAARPAAARAGKSKPSDRSAAGKRTSRKQAAAKPTPRKAASAKPAKIARVPLSDSLEEQAYPPRVIPLEIEQGSVEDVLAKVRDELAHWVKKGRYTKVRFKVRGRPVLPDIPLAALVAAEAVTFWWAGLLKALVAHVGAGALLDVELVSGAVQEVSRGKLALLGGDLERAVELFRKALEMDRDCASAHLNLGVAFKLKNDTATARRHLEKAEQLDSAGASGEEARRLLDQLNGGTSARRRASRRG